MDRTDRELLASVEFRLDWEKNGIRHSDALHAPRVNFWRDLLPPPLADRLLGRRVGETVAVDFAPGQATPPRRSDRVRRVGRRQITTPARFGAPIEPHYGRIYPAGILVDVPGVFPDNITPFRCVAVDGDGIVADLNHPLADVPVTLSATVEEVRPKFEERGGTCNDWAEMAADGPGFQARIDGRATDFFAAGAFDRDDPSPDGRFYRQPRMVQHIDDEAVAAIRGLYGRLLPPGGRILDLMSSWTSHLPEDAAYAAVTGLGLNAEELDANPRLTDRRVQDLNADPLLPYADGAFDAAVCTVSVEYLVRPWQVFAEVARVLRPGGLFAVTFSDRWFPPKAIRVWREAHPFERPGIVLEYFLQSGRFGDLRTYSLRGRPRPVDDKYADQNPVADPVFAVWGRTGGAAG